MYRSSLLKVLKKSYLLHCQILHFANRWTAIVFDRHFLKMKLIPLSQSGKNAGKYFAIVDDEDYSFLMQWKWAIGTSKSSKNIYAVRSHSPKQMHRVILKLTDKNKFVDHIDHNGLNNQKNNLRIATSSENNKNTKSSGFSKYLGVALHKQRIISFRKKTNDYVERLYVYWQANIRINGKNINLGTFKNEIDAAQAYNNAAIKYHGEFANINIL